ncbi:ABC transporter ATP-binding protein [Mycoplasmatota bacterium]|nr:ABC transporter ATP-binding protein [Mycoplasmatota bacterium]
MRTLKSSCKAFALFVRLSKFYLFDSFYTVLRQLVITVIPIYLINEIVKLITEGKGFHEILKIIIIVGIIYILFALGDVIEQYLSSKYSIVVKTKVNISLFKKLNTIDYKNHEDNKFLNKYTLAVDQSYDFLNRSYYSVVNFIGSIVSSIYLLSVLFQVHYFISIYAFLVAIIYFIVQSIVVELIYESNETQQPNFRERAYVRRTFYLKDHIEDIKSTDVDEILLEINDTVGNRITKNCDNYFRRRVKYNFFCDFLINSIFIVAVIFLVYQTIHGNTDKAIFAGLVYASLSLSNFISRFINSLSGIQYSAKYTKYYFDVMDIKGSIEEHGDVIAEPLNTITINNVDFSYDTNKNALSNIDLEIKKGEKIAIVGHNGAGKTTLVKLLLRLYDPTKGEITYNDHAYTKINPKSIREKIGAVFQNFQIYAVSIAENILLRPVESEEDERLVHEALEFSGLKRHVDLLPNGIYTEVTKEFEKEGTIFSGGQRQKLALSRVYAQNYDLIVLDEPSSALDPLAEHEIHENMFKLGKNKMLIFISHRLSTTIKADKIYLFEGGQLVEEGSHKELMKIENGKYKYMFEVQAKNYLDDGGNKDA